MSKLDFPKNFYWGAGNSAPQVEGNNLWNDWHYYQETRNYIKTGEKEGKAADHYNRYQEDFDLAKKLNHNATRLSIEWSRIEKEKGVYDQKEIEHYRNVLKYLKKMQITSFVTLHHFSNPSWFTLSGGWTRKDAPETFNKFVEVIVHELGEDVDYWLTINEPSTYISLGYLVKGLPPLLANPYLAYKASRNLFKAHKLTYQTIHHKIKNAKVGPVLNVQLMTDRKNKTDGPLKNIVNYWANFYFGDNMCKYADFLGVNYYFPIRIFKNQKDTDLGWEIYPKGIYDALLKTWGRYKLPMIVTENGLADSSDSKRAAFIKRHLAEIHQAIKQGSDIFGYLHWSLTDNLELEKGFWPKFGLIEINFETQERKIKPSALEYAQICKDNYLEIK